MMLDERIPATVILPNGTLMGVLIDERRGPVMATEDGGSIQHVRIIVRVRSPRGELDVVDRAIGRDTCGQR